ncbi:MAG: S8 family serine peptidase [Lachnospiraceae bacterium]|nr:S8 family serine peptidase [Lachnospiraceae bacterium]
MKNFRTKKLLAVILAVVLVTLQSGPAFATEGAQNEVQETVQTETGTQTPAASETQEGEQADTGDAAKPAKEETQISENETVLPEESTVPSGEEITVSENTETPADEISEPAEETVSEDVIPEEETAEPVEPETVSEDSASGNAVINGFLSELTTEQIKNAEFLKEDIKELESLEPEEDYVPNEATFLADTEEEAKEIADSYGAELIHFAHGVAAIAWSDKTVDEAFKDVVKNVEDVKKAEEYISSDENGQLPLSSLKAANEELYNTVSRINIKEIPDKRVEPNYIAHICAVDPSNDPIYAKTKSTSDTSGQWFHLSISSANAWAAGADGTGVTVAVIDTGIDTSNNDLSGNHIEALYSSKSFKSGEDDNGHGTHCAGIVAALDNDLGGLGVAPNAKIISIKAGNYRGSLPNTDINEAIRIAIDKNVDIISMSFGGGSTDATEALLKEATSKGITCIAAAGNEHTNDEAYPAAYSCTLAVGAYDPGDDEKLASYSNWGGWVDVAAPGTDIYATMPDDPSVWLRDGDPSGPAFRNQITEGCSYAKLNGTSMATPAVAGIAALIKSVHKDYSPAQVKMAIRNSDPKKVYKYNSNVVYRGVNAYAALTAPTDELIDPDEVEDDRIAPAVEQPNKATMELGVGPAISVAQGKSVKMGAVVLPSTTTKIRYTVSGDSSITVTKKGLIKVSKTAAVGTTATVTATCGLLSASTKVTVTASPTAGDFTLTKSHEDDLSVATGIGKNSVDITVTGGDPNMVYRFTVSSKKVALFSNKSTTISAKGGEKVTLLAAGNGKATVTAYATDGSGKKASVKVKCMTPLTDAMIKYAKAPITGPVNMAVGGKLKLKPAAVGTKASKVTGKTIYTWSGPYVSKKGVVHPDANAKDQSFTVTLTAVNNGISKSTNVTINVKKEKKIKLLGYMQQSYYGYIYYNGSTVDKASKGEKLDIYSMPDFSSHSVYGPYGFTRLGRNPAGEKYSTNDGDYAVSVSGGKKIKVYSYGPYGVKTFKALKKGTYTVTYTALDGSGKKFRRRIKVK